MARESMNLLELLRKRGMGGDMDFLREALGVLVEGIMDAEVSVKTVDSYGERSADRVLSVVANYATHSSSVRLLSF